MNQQQQRSADNAVSRLYVRTKKMTSRQCWFALSVVVLVLSAIAIVLTQAAESMENKLKIIIDSDGGSDDAMAIFYALRAEKYSKLHNKTNGPEILGITCVNGNTVINNVVVNVLKTLQTVGRLDIPVYRGAEQSILKTPPSENYFGKDGMGDVPYPNSPSPELVQSEHAVNALIRLVDENPGEITLVALGPLTNIAMAARLDESFLLKLKKLFILGGNIHGQGNTAPGVEFNFYMDPEANYIILNGSRSREKTILLLPLETWRLADITNEWRRDVLGELDSPEITFMNTVEHVEKLVDDKQWIFADVMMAALVLNESLITKTNAFSVEAITEGKTRGMLLVDHTDLLRSKKKIDIILNVDFNGYKNSLLEHFS